MTENNTGLKTTEVSRAAAKEYYEKSGLPTLIQDFLQTHSRTEMVELQDLRKIVQKGMPRNYCPIISKLYTSKEMNSDFYDLCDNHKGDFNMYILSHFYQSENADCYSFIRAIAFPDGKIALVGGKRKSTTVLTQEQIENDKNAVKKAFEKACDRPKDLWIKKKNFWDYL